MGEMLPAAAAIRRIAICRRMKPQADLVPSPPRVIDHSTVQIGLVHPLGCPLGAAIPQGRRRLDLLLPHASARAVHVYTELSAAVKSFCYFI
jgi:hypothetical protein